MKLFENKVGRPSNDVLKKRKNAKILIVSAVVVVLGLVTYGIYSLTGVTGMSKNIKATDATFKISGINGGFIYKTKYYAKKKTLSLGSTSLNKLKKDEGLPINKPLGNNVLFFAATGNTSFNIVGQFGVKMRSPEDGKPLSFSIQSYDSKGNNKGGVSVLVRNASHTLKMTARKEIKYFIITLSKSGKTLYSSMVYISNLPTIEHIKVTAATQNSSGVFLQKESGVAKMKFKITNYSGHKLYYRWFTYKNDVAKSSKVISKNETCRAYDSTITTQEYPLSVTRPRAAVIRIYTSYDECKKDNKAKYPIPSNASRKVLTQKTVKYKLMNTTTNSEGFTVVSRFNKATIGKNIGSQTQSACNVYAYRYAYYMKYGKYTTGYNPVCTTYSNTQDLLNKVKKYVDAGSPIMVFFRNNYGTYKQHWAVAVGYKLNSNGKLTNLSQVYFLDPYSSLGYGRKGANVLWAGQAFDSKGKSLRNTMLGLKNNTYCYVQ